MKMLDLAPIVSQTFDYTTYAFTWHMGFFQLTPTLLTSSIAVTNNQTGERHSIVDNHVVCANELLIPFPYMMVDGSNFVFGTPNDEIPNYKEFGAAHRLFHLTADDIRVIRNA